MGITNKQKLTMVKAMLMVTDDSEDDLLGVYLDAAEKEILAWRYSYVEGWEDLYDEVPAEYDMTQVMAVLAGYNIIGAEGQISHSENGIQRQWRYEDMVAYIRSHVIPVAVPL